MMHVSKLLALILPIGFGLASPTPSIEERNNGNNGCSVGLAPARAAAVKAAFTSSGVVPTLIPSIEPRVEVSVLYGSKAVNLGNTFTIIETAAPPALSFNAENGCPASTTKYSYFLLDPDVPGPGALSMPYLHWSVSGAQPNCIKNQSPNTVTIYETPTPASIARHRYTFLVFREPAGYTPDLVTAQLRPGFDINAYAAKGGLVLVGGNFLREGALDV